MRAPDWLGATAKAKWKEVTKAHPELSADHRDTLALLCQSWQLYLDALKLIETQGQTILSAANGRWFVNPAVNVANESWKQVLKASQLLGILPEKKQADEPEDLEF